MSAPPDKKLRRDTRIFISAALCELGAVRKLVKKALEENRYHAVEQKSFPPDYRKIVDELRERIASCDAMVHIAGLCFGAEPRRRPNGAPRRSYSQLEYDLAVELGKPIYVFITDTGFPSDVQTRETKVRSLLQEAHRQDLRTKQDTCERVGSHNDLAKLVRSLSLGGKVLRVERPSVHTSPERPSPPPKFDTFLSHSHEDSSWVDGLARRLEDRFGLRVWLDRWILVPGSSWQQAMARGLEEASTCAVCVGGNTPRGWFREEIERALDLQTRNADFRVIPIMLPDAMPENVPAFASLRTWADFREGKDQEYALHVLAQGICGQPVGRWPVAHPDTSSDRLQSYRRLISELAQLGLHQEVVIEFERKIASRWLEEG